MGSETERTRHAVDRLRRVTETMVPIADESIEHGRIRNQTKRCERGVDLSEANVEIGIEEEALAAHRRCVVAVAGRRTVAGQRTVANKVPDKCGHVDLADRGKVQRGRGE